MKKYTKMLGLASALSLVSVSVMADHARHYRTHQTDVHVEKARVTYVEPVYRTVTVSRPERVCDNLPSRTPSRQQSYTRTIAGGIIGGVVGNQFGGGNGKTVMTIAGTLLGGSLGRDLDMARQQTHYDSNTNCQIVEHHYQEQHIDGYEVNYRYRGKSYTTIMDHHPGQFIPVDVHVKPRRYY